MTSTMLEVETSIDIDTRFDVCSPSCPDGGGWVALRQLDDEDDDSPSVNESNDTCGRAYHLAISEKTYGLN